MLTFTKFNRQRYNKR